jgi:PAS domain S-box-containing protein
VETGKQEIMIENEVFKALFTHANEGILIVSEGKIDRANNSAYKLFGYELGELSGKPIEFLMPKKYQADHVPKRDGYTKDPKARPMGNGVELYGLRKNGEEFPVEISLSPFDQNNKRFVIAFVMDISSRKAAEQKLKTYSIELEKEVKDRTLVLEEAISQLEKTKEELNIALLQERELNDLKSRFVSMASHEFRTPLATILSSLSLVNKYNSLENEEKRVKHIARIKSSVHNMTDILNDFLSLSRLEEGKIAFDPEEFDLYELANNIVQELQQLTKDDQQINFTYTGKKQLFSDKKIIRNILTNLISNAVKFSNEKGQVSVNISGNEGTFLIEVSDNGIGISNEDKKHLFERFFRGKNATNIQGTGLGLNIVAKYVEVLNGKIAFESELEKGTKFSISIPVK